MEFENYDLVEIPSNVEGTMVVETDETGKITNNKTEVTYYYAKKSAGVEEHHIDIKTQTACAPASTAYLFHRKALPIHSKPPSHSPR